MASDEHMEGCNAGDDYHGRQLSRLGVRNSSATSGNNVRPGIFSMPGTPDRRPVRRAVWDKDYDSDAGAPRRRRRPQGRERWLEQSWEMRRSREASEEPDGECLVLVRPKGRDWSTRMDMEEVKACRDLGIELPCDWTAEIAYADTSSGGNSPVNSWRISSPGDDPNEVKARLKSWAQAVAFASTSRLR